jgi:hypothetical protein
MALGNRRHRIAIRLPRHPDDLLSVDLDFFILPSQRGQFLN